MVISQCQKQRKPVYARRRGLLITEAVVAMGILVIAVVPLGYLFLRDARLFRMSYQRAVAIELVDGEMEILAAGEWQAFPEGTHVYTAGIGAGTNLPPGRFVFDRSGNHLRLEWTPDRRMTGIGRVTREVTLK